MNLSDEQIKSYKDKGYLIIKNMFSKSVINKVLVATKQFDSLKYLPNVVCESNGEIRSIFAPHKRSDIFDLLYKQERLVKPTEQLIGDKVYLYQFKLNNKKAFNGKSWEWHQDFPYWNLDDGICHADMISAMILLQDTSIIQGPLIVIPRSQKNGVVEFEYKKHLHDKSNGKKINLLNSLNNDLKFTVNKRILSSMINKEGVVVCEGTVGTCIFFHPNLFHASNSNISPFDRNTAIITYNSINNIPSLSRNIRPDYLCSREFFILNNKG